MNFFEHDGRLYEVTGIGPVDEYGFHYECFDLTPGSGGMLGKIVVPEAHDEVDVQVELLRQIPAPVLFQWMRLVPELAELVLGTEASGG